MQTFHGKSTKGGIEARKGLLVTFSSPGKYNPEDDMKIFKVLNDS